MKQKQSDYMHWAKTRSQARFNLASSGVGRYPISELAFDPARFEVNNENSYGYRPLQEAIGQHAGVDPACVVEAAGTSMANHLAMAAVLEPGDDVLIETPVYTLFTDVAHYLGVSVNRFVRREEDGWAINPAAVKAAMTPRTRLIVVTNLHNPTSVLTPEPDLRDLARIAQEAKAWLLVDEVYLDAVFDHTPRTAFHLGDNVIITNSLTKVYGLSGLRCGWILAQPDLAWKMRRLNDLFSATPVHPGELLSVAAFARLPELRQRARRMIEADRTVLQSFLERETRLSAVSTDWGTTCFARLNSGDTETFIDRLRDEFETSVVPGRFFERADHFRIGLGVDSAMFAEGLKRLERALGTR